ncbi:OmcA/MtrC family decaheme c-type cytochrome [Ramlibacter alkalitolerans]|uniref:OmcA/MtrC family decaheme c-type cytochrome n=1 Tax=Ramlibacter alkalitolerans TaxID=2039631 RepID=A0ABS1JLC5_9BURK|nr:OmcA/MtrC family decaheme c-type cytochrome [Ramlibacter alkalitolerans]MBL0425032.1 OmcA/MtrC family decaheme c-type cytochrome [Ramlibacter alkalitolerans]
MLNSFMRHGKMAIAALSVLLAACGGGGGGGDAPASPGGAAVDSGALAQAIATAAAIPANDSATSTSASFAVVQSAGVPAVTINSPPVVKFTVFSNGKVVQGLTLANMRFALAKLVPGTNGDPDQWVNYISRKETATPTVGPNGKAALASAMQATTDPQPADAATPQLVFNPAGYYTYTFSTNVKDPAKTNGVVFEPARTHRVAIQLSYQNAAGETVLVNPYFDFTIDANGNSVAVTDPALTRKMTDVSSCNTCHEKLALHGGGRVDTQFCVMCHNPGTTDANSGNVLTLSTMVHKIHAGKLLKSKGEDYTIWGYNNTKVSFAEVGFPQDLRNCTKCHTGSNPATPQGDNWKSKASREACLTCHDSKPGSFWFTQHTFFNQNRDPNAAATFLKNSECVRCHAPGGAISPERVHFNQNEENAAKYKMNIEAASYDAGTNQVTLKYFLSDPTSNNAAYDLVTSECTGTPVTCSGSTKFGNLRLIVGYGSLAGQAAGTTEFTSYNNGGNTAAVFAYTGKNDGSNHYTATVSLPTPSATHVISGTARVVSIGQIKEPKLQVQSTADPRPQVTPRALVNVVVQNTFKEFALTGTLQPRRQVVSSEKCNVCHGALGTTSGANTLAEAFHSGARNIVEACVICHDPNKVSSTKMTNGVDLNESYQFKRMIHGIHGSSRRTFPFTHGNAVVGAFNKDGTSATGGAPLAAGVENYAAEVAWPGVGINCNVCHVDNSYKLDKGTVGAVIKKDAGVTDPLQWKVISPKAASCTACHDSPKAMGHVASFGNATFGDKTQALSMVTTETCMDCHASGMFKGVDIVHGQK